MAFKPNYGMQRADRARSREAKREEKLRQRQERSNERKAQSTSEEAVTQQGGGAVSTDRPGEPRKS